MLKLIMAGTAGLCLWLAGCVSFEGEMARGETKRETQTFELGKSEMVDVQVEMGAGKLRVTGGSPKLMEADVRYSGKRPEIRYDETGFRGRLLVKQQSETLRMNAENEWDISLNQKIPMDIRVKLGAGEAEVNLADVAPRNVEIELGAGSLKADLRGNYTKDVDVQIRGGVGEAIVRLPRDIGVIAKAKGGLGQIEVQGLKNHGGEYTNDAYRTSKVTMRVDVSGGIGKIQLIGE